MTAKTKKIKILFIIVQMKMGGSEHLVWDIIRSLDRQIFQPHLAWFYEEEPLKVFNDLEIPLYFVPKKKRFDFGAMRQIAKIIRGNGIDVVNAHHYLSMVYSFYGCKMVNNIRLIYTEHSEWEIKAISRKWRLAGKLLLRCADTTVGVSESVTTCLKNVFNLSDTKMKTISNGVDYKLFQSELRKDKYKLIVGLDPDEIVVGIVANLKKNKNHIFLLKAFRNLLNDNKNLKLLIIGQGFMDDPESSEKDIQDYIKNEHLAPYVQLLGGRSDVPDLLKCLDIFCLTSYKEGLPISLIEAMAAGLPVIGTDVDGIQDVVVNDKNGYLVKIGDEQQLTNALSRLIGDKMLRIQFGASSRRLAEKLYSFDKCINDYQSLYIGKEF
jgi:L-malate glycosyltransferase